MSEPVAKVRPDVEFDEFERRLRQSEGGSDFHSRQEDPLAELARLVGHNHDPYGDVFGEDAMARRASDYSAYEKAGLLAPAFDTDPNLSPRLSGDFAAIEAGLRSGAGPHAPALDHHESVYYPDHGQEAAYQADPAYSQDQPYLQDHEAPQWAADGEQPPAEAARKSRRSIYAMVATIAIGVIGVGAAFAYKGSSSSPSEIKTIAAASGPTKIQPPADAKPDQPGQDSAMLGKGQQAAPTQLVSREEQPVDISQAVQHNAPRNADAGGAPGDATSVPLPLSPSQARDGGAEAPSPSDPIGSFGMSGMPVPKKVKVVSVRPDGTILPNDAPPAGALPPSVRAIAAGKPAETPAPPEAKASTPKGKPTGSAKTTTSAKPAISPKSTSRVASTPKPTRVAAADSAADVGDETAASAPKPSKKPKPAKPQRVAAAEATDDADATASLPAAKSGGGFAVQLAAPGSEADAKSASSRLAKKFASALGGRKLGFRKADSNGKSVYRVRVGSLSKEDATSLCEKLKADGGSCFVAKN